MSQRQSFWQQIAGPWDVLIIGGGITGAGILRLASMMGWRALLLEQRDFAWGASSRSGKLVHGGLRYLKQGQIQVTRQSVRERERLLREAPGLVEPQRFLLPVYGGQAGLKLVYRLGLTVYDLLAGRRTWCYFAGQDLLMQVPQLAQQELQGGFSYRDACTDDARLVLRLILEAVDDGGIAINYAHVTDLLRGTDGQVNGAVVRDEVTGESARVQAGVVINATGTWADFLRSKLGRTPLIRPLRGSHLIFPGWRLPLAQGVNLLHPQDGRPLYIFPWEGATLAGTTDLDHTAGLVDEPGITPAEKAYLLTAMQAIFPSLRLRDEDIMSAFAGVRPVIGTGKRDPSKESREMLVRDEGGLLTVTGGKLTTFRLLALKALEQAGKKLCRDISALYHKQVFQADAACLPHHCRQTQLRLAGRYGRRARQMFRQPLFQEWQQIPGTVYFWPELRHTARHELVVHLDDLLLRRLRLGLVSPDGGIGYLAQVKDIVCPVLGWDQSRWQAECDRYMSIWRQAYQPCLPGGD